MSKDKTIQLENILGKIYFISEDRAILEISHNYLITRIGDVSNHMDYAKEIVGWIKEGREIKLFNKAGTLIATLNIR